MANPRFRPSRWWTAAAWMIACGVLSWANDPGTIPPAELKKAELTYKDTFGPAHDKASKATKAAEKSEFAKKLLDAHAKAASDPPLQEVLRKYALQFAQPTDPVGLSVAMDVYKVYLGFPSRKAMALDKIAGLQERGLATEPAATRLKLTADVVKGYRDAASEYEKQGNATAATAAIGKARIVVRKYTPGDRDTLAALDGDERRMQAVAAEQADVERLKAFVAKNPDDAKARVALASRYLKFGRTLEAADLFHGSGADWTALAAALQTKPVDALAAAKAILKGQSALSVEDKKTRFVLATYARTLLEDFRNGSADKWPDAIPTYAAVLELAVANESGANAGQNATPLVLALIEWAEQLVGKFDYTEATNVLVRARAVSKGAKSTEIKDLQADLDAAERAVKANIALEAEIAQWKAEEAKGALDAKGNLAYGVALLRADRSAEAVKRLSQSGVPAFVNLSKLLANRDSTPPLAFGDALRTAAGELQGNEKTDVLAIARASYERYLESNPKDGPEKTRIQLLAKELPESTRKFATRDYVELFDDNPATLAKLLSIGKGAGGGTFVEETKDVFRGKSALRTTPAAVNFWDLGWRYSVVESPKKPNEFRYLGFAWKKAGGASCGLQLLDASNIPPRNYQYFSGTFGNGAEKTVVRNLLPTSWTYEIRDVFEDYGAITVTGFQAWPNDGQYELLDAVYLSKSKASLERLAAKK